MFNMAELDDIEIWHELKEIVGWENGQPIPHITRHEIIRELIGQSVTDVLENTMNNINEHNIDSVEKVQQHERNLVGYSVEFGPKVRELKKFLLDRMYRHYRLIRMQTKAERFITELFNAYVQEPKMLPTDTQKLLDKAPISQVVTDYIAGMTDRYALAEWEKLFDPNHRA